MPTKDCFTLQSVQETKPKALFSWGRLVFYDCPLLLFGRGRKVLSELHKKYSNGFPGLIVSLPVHDMPQENRKTSGKEMTLRGTVRLGPVGCRANIREFYP